MSFSKNIITTLIFTNIIIIRCKKSMSAAAGRVLL